MQVKMHGAEKCASRQEIKACKSYEETRLKIIVANRQFQLADFLQCPGVLQLFQAVGFIQLEQFGIETGSPVRKSLRRFAHRWLQHTGDFLQRRLREAMRCA